MHPLDQPDVDRRQYLGLLAAASLSGCTGAFDGGDTPTDGVTPTDEPTPSGAAGDEWPQYRRSVDGNPVVESVAFGSAGFSVRWRHEVSAYSWRQSQPPTPVVSEGVVVFPGSDRVIAYDATGGEEQWSIEDPASRPQPCVADGVAYVPVEGSGDAASLGAYDLASGDEEWVADHGDPQWPVVHRGTLYVRGSSDGAPSIVAVDASSGDREWTAGEESAVTPAVLANETLVVGTEAGLRAYDLDSGDEMWAEPPEDPVVAPPTIADGSVYVGTEGGVLRSYALAYGSEQWSTDFPDDIEASPAVADGTVVAVNFDDSFESDAIGRCYAHDASSGDELWTFDSLGAVRAAPVVIDDAVLFTSTSRHVHAVSLDGGDERWSTWYRGLTSTMPVVTESAMYVATQEELLAFEAREEPIGTSDVGGWETPAGDPAYTRYRSDAAAVTDAAAIEFDVQLESDFQHQFITGPLLASDGKVLAWMVARDANTGEVAWRPPGFGWPQAVTGDVVAMSGFQQYVHGASLTDGGIAWRTDVGEAPFRLNAADETVVATHPSEGTRALDAASGEVLWSTEDHGGAWQPLVGEDAVYVPDPHHDERVKAYDLASGDELASRDVPAFEPFQRGETINRPPKFGGAQRSPLLGDDRVYLPALGTVLALDRSTLEPDWQREIATSSSATATALAYDGETVYYTHSDGMVALDPATGDTECERAMDSSPSDLIVTDDTMYVPAWQTLHGVDPDSGEDLWTREFDDVLAEMALGDDRLFLRSKSPPMQDYDPRLRALTT